MCTAIEIPATRFVAAQLNELDSTRQRVSRFNGMSDEAVKAFVLEKFFFFSRVIREKKK